MMRPEQMDDGQLVAAYHGALAESAAARAGAGNVPGWFDAQFHPAVEAMLDARICELKREASGGGAGAFDRLRAAMSLREFVAQYEACRDRTPDMARELEGLAAGVARAEGSVREPLPLRPWQGTGDAAEALRGFAECNPMYGPPLHEGDYAWYEADINARWLESTSHEASRAPFSPTWLLSALAIAERASRSGYCELIDVGSGDGRVAFCAALRGMRAISIELDPGLADMQRRISEKTGISLEVACADAARAAWPQDLKRPVFAIGGLAQMGASALAEAAHAGLPGAGFVLAGTRAPKYGGTEPAGWGGFVESAGLEVRGELCLPAAWTAGGPGVPYVFAGPGRSV